MFVAPEPWLLSAEKEWINLQRLIALQTPRDLSGKTHFGCLNSPLNSFDHYPVFIILYAKIKTENSERLYPIPFFATAIADIRQRYSNLRLTYNTRQEPLWMAMFMAILRRSLYVVTWYAINRTKISPKSHPNVCLFVFSVYSGEAEDNPVTLVSCLFSFRILVIGSKKKKLSSNQKLNLNTCN